MQALLARYRGLHMYIGDTFHTIMVIVIILKYT